MSKKSFPEISIVLTKLHFDVATVSVVTLYLYWFWYLNVISMLEITRGPLLTYIPVHIWYHPSSKTIDIRLSDTCLKHLKHPTCAVWTWPVVFCLLRKPPWVGGQGAGMEAQGGSVGAGGVGEHEEVDPWIHGMFFTMTGCIRISYFLAQGGIDWVL